MKQKDFIRRITNLSNEQQNQLASRLPRLSFTQQRFWFLAQLAPASNAYNTLLSLRLTGKLDLVALELSINEIVRRHDILRTTFVVIGDRPYQVIAPSLKISLPVTELSYLLKAERDSEVRRIATEMVQHNFDLENGPLVHTQLLRLQDGEFVFFWGAHHIIFDAWSTNVFMNELAILYEAFTNDTQASLPELPIQYADFASWQRKWLQGEVLEKQLEYWRQHLRDAPDLLDLPTDRPRAERQRFQGGTQFFKLSKDVSILIKSLSQSEGVTVFMMLLAAFKTLLYRYTAQEKISIGVFIHIPPKRYISKFSLEYK
jgi:NRPS condensation-like uncharacterized protein